MTLPATYAFPEANNVGIAVPPWTYPVFVFYPVGDGAAHAKAQFTGNDCPAIWTADTFLADQYAQFTVESSPAGAGQDYANLILRAPNASSSTFPDCYVFYTDGVSDTEIGMLSGGSETLLASSSSVTYTPGDVFKFEVIGSVLTAYKNGTSILSASDATYTSGYPGFDLWTTSNNVRIGSFMADNASGGSPGVHTVSGSGSFTVSSPNWLSTAISGRPAYLGSGNANPANWYHVGMLSWGTSNGAMVAYPVSRDLDLVKLPSGLDTVWYEFATGVTAVITELSGP